MKMGFTDTEYARVRDWLMTAMEPNPGVISERELIEKLRSLEWTLITTENAACVLQLCTVDGEKIANVLLVGGRKNRALRELMRVLVCVCDALSEMGYVKLVGEPRAEWHRYLLRFGFKKEQEEFTKRLSERNGIDSKNDND